MGAETGLIWIVLSVVLLLSTVGLGFAYRRAQETTATLTNDLSAYAQVIEGSNDAVLVIDFVDGRILRTNTRAAGLLGHTKERLLALTVFDLHAPEHLAQSAMRIADAWEKKGTVYSDIPFRSATGDTIAVECSTTVTYHGERPAVVLFARDIRERLQLQCAVEEQQHLVRSKSDEVLASLRYASTIQYALLPTENALRSMFSDAFVLFKPRDIVSGDFHWTARVGDTVLVAVADCTGHGVPGAFLSVIGNSLLRSIVLEQGITDPASVLGRLREGIVQALRGPEQGTRLRDGMDIALVAVDLRTRTARFAGAMNPLYVIRRVGDAQELIETKGDRLPIGFIDGMAKAFTTHSMQLLPGDKLYMFSDGFADQFGGAEGKKIKPVGFKRLLLETSNHDMAQQRSALDIAFNDWKIDHDQVDDVLLVGLQV
ncbi:MAG: SpoIIE family protein phosphatase [Flavobacteriales bacterium]|nr:SpoIIE family protein phosphatase [Flavobacteriales bacterium]